MPIDTVDVPEGAMFASPADRLVQQARDLAVAGDPIARAAEPPAPSWGEAWRARAGTSLVQSITDYATKRSFGIGGTPEAAFNPYRYVASRPELRDDPGVRALVERGQFDHSNSLQEFEYDLEAGRSFMRDSETIGRASALQGAATMAGAMLGDPTNLLPLGPAWKLLQGGRTAAQVAKAAAFAGATALAVEKTHNVLTPASDEPGPANEFLAFGTGAAVGGLLGVLTSPAFQDSARGFMATRKVNQLRRDLTAMMSEPAVRAYDPSKVADTSALGRATLGQEIQNGKDLLRRALAEDPVDNKVVSALRFAGDDNPALIEQLQAKYSAAGKRLHVVDHPDQWYADLAAEVQSIIDHPAMNAEAGPKDFSGYGFLDAAASALTSRYANLQARATPGGRLAQATLARLNDVYRTLAGSAQTIPRGSAADPFNFEAGAAAENVRLLYEAAKDNATLGLRAVYAKAGRGGPITYGGAEVPPRFGYGEFRAAVNDLLRREHARSLGLDVDAPPDTHASVREGAAVIRAYFRRMRDEAERSGVLAVGPEAARKAQDAVAPLEAERTAVAARLADAQAAGDPAAVESATKELAAADEKLAAQRGTAKRYADIVKGQEFYLPRVFDVPAIMASPEDFMARIAGSFRDLDAVQNGRRVPVADRPLVPEVQEKLDPEALKAVAAKKPAPPPGAAPAGLTEGELPPDLLAAYRAELDGYYRRNARAVLDKLTAPNERHGVADASASDPAVSRALETNEADIAPYLVRDVEQVLERYHRAMAGRIAVRRAIQLNPGTWANAKLKDGTPVTDGASMMSYLRETVSSLDEFARLADRQAGRDVGGAGSLVPFVRNLRRRVENDVRVPLEIMEGRNPIAHDAGVFGALSYFGRNAVRWTGLQMLGSAAWASLNDFAPIVTAVMQRPRAAALIPRAIFNLKGLPARDLEALGLMVDNIARARALADVDALGAGQGFGEGLVRRASAAAERGIDGLNAVQARLSGLEWLTSVQKRIAGGLVIDKATDLSKRMLRAQALIDGGAEQAAAYRAAGIEGSGYEVARLNKLGLNAERAKRYHELAYEHGLTTADEPIKDSMTFPEYMASDAMFKPNFAEWDLAAPADRALFDTVAANIAGEVNHAMIVTPGEFDLPLIHRTLLGRIFGQFQGFLFGFVNQRLRPVAQAPAKYQLWHLMGYQFLGALSDAISNHLSGRRSLDETAQLWGDNPVGMSYQAFRRGGLAGWFDRPLSIADALGVPFSPGNLTGQIAGSTASSHVSAQEPLSYLGPVFADVNKLATLTTRVSQGKADRTAAYQAAKLLPFQNSAVLRLLYRTTGAPVVPEAIVEDHRKPLPPAP